MPMWLYSAACVIMVVAVLDLFLAFSLVLCHSSGGTQFRMVAGGFGFIIGIRRNDTH